MTSDNPRTPGAEATYTQAELVNRAALALHALTATALARDAHPLLVSLVSDGGLENLSDGLVLLAHEMLRPATSEREPAAEPEPEPISYQPEHTPFTLPPLTLTRQVHTLTAIPHGIDEPPV